MSTPQIIPADDPHRMAQAIATIQASYVTHQDLMALHHSLTVEINATNGRIDNVRIELGRRIELLSEKLDRRMERLSEKLDSRTDALSQAIDERALAQDRRSAELMDAMHRQAAALTDVFNARIEAAVARSARSMNRWGVGLVATLVLGMTPMYVMMFQMSHELGGLAVRVDQHTEDMAALRQDVTVLKQDVTVLKQDVNVLKQDVSGLKQDVAGMKQDIGDIKRSLAALAARQTGRR